MAIHSPVIQNPQKYKKELLIQKKARDEKKVWKEKKGQRGEETPTKPRSYQIKSYGNPKELATLLCFQQNILINKTL